MGEPAPTADEELLRRIAAGDTAALGQFYDSHGGTLFALACRILNDHNEAEDVVQEVFLQIWDKAAVFNPAQGRPLGWVLTLTRNKAIDRLRSAQRRARLVEAAGAEFAQGQQAQEPSAPQAAGAGEEAKVIHAALRRLPVDQRRAIEMAFFGRLTQNEIAAALQQPLGTVKARIRRGMLKLREEVGARL